MSTAGELLGEGAAQLASAAIERPRFEARLLLEAATGQDRTSLLAGPGQAVGKAQTEEFRRLVQRRAGHEPMAYILGRAEFWSLEFAVGPGILVPRPDTETLVEHALRLFPHRDRALRLLDIGTGSGCRARSDALLTIAPPFSRKIGSTLRVART